MIEEDSFSEHDSAFSSENDQFIAELEMAPGLIKAPSIVKVASVQSVSKDASTHLRQMNQLSQQAERERGRQLKKHRCKCKAQRQKRQKERSLSPHVYGHGEAIEYESPGLMRHRTTIAKRITLEDAPEFADKKPEVKKPKKFFQGRQIKDGIGAFQRITDSFIDPLLEETNNNEEIHLEQLGLFNPESDISKLAPELEEAFAYYNKKNPGSRRNVLWSFFWVFRHRIGFVWFCKFIEMCMDLVEPMLVKQSVQIFEKPAAELGGKDDFNTALKILALYFLNKQITRVVRRVMYSYMQLMGTTASEAMTFWMYSKNFKVSSSSNIQFTSGELKGVIERESNVIWDFTYRMSDQFFTPFSLLYSAIALWSIMGWSVIAGVVLYAVQWFLNKQIDNFIEAYCTNPALYEISGKKEDKLNELFTYAKQLKLFGWQKKFEKEFTDLREQEASLDTSSGFSQIIGWNLQSIVYNFLPMSIFMTSIYIGNPVSMANYFAADMLIGKIRWPIRELFNVKGQIKNLDRSMYRIQKVLTLDEIQESTYLKTPVDSDIAVYIKGNFSWKLGEPEKEEDELRKKDKKEEVVDDNKSISDDSSDFQEQVSDDEATELKDAKEKEAKEEEKKEESQINKPQESESKETTAETNTEKKDDKEDDKKKTAKSMDVICTLKDIDLQIKRGEFIIIIGKIGAGKTSLLQAMLNEMTFIPDDEIERAGGIKGSLTGEEQNELRKRIYGKDLKFKGGHPIRIAGNVTYVEQQAWIQNMTIRDNILFGSEFDDKKYVQTLMACQLESDLENLAAGDMTEIGERGINLSGGQRARVSLARAVYRSPDVILMDDPISALDAIVRKKIFNQVFNGLLKGKTRILVTHSIDFVPLADRVVFIKEGRIDAVGTPNELKDHEYLKEIQDIAKKNLEEAEKKKKDEQSNKLEAMLDDMNKNEKTKKIAAEESNKKQMEERNALNKILAINTLQVQDKLRKFAGNKSLEDVTELGKLFKDDEDDREAKKAKLDTGILRQTFVLLGGFVSIAYFTFADFLTQSVNTYNDFKEKDFYALSESEQSQQMMKFVFNFIMIKLGIMAIDLVKEWAKKKKNKRVLNRLYDTLFAKMVNAPINEFYEITPIDTIISRFHSSIRIFENDIMSRLVGIFSSVSDLIIKAGIMYTISGWLGVLCLVAGYMFFTLGECRQKWYAAFDPIRTELSKKYSVSAYATHEGNPLIRCFGQEQFYINKKKNSINFGGLVQEVQRYGSNRISGKVQFIDGIFFLIAAMFLFRSRGFVDPVILTTVFFQVNNVEWISYVVWEVADLKENINKAKWAIKIQEICPQEKVGAEVKVDPTVWPIKGDMDFKNVKLKYRSHLPEVLKGLTFKVQSGHKVGIVGRTAAGKSTLSLAITRIVELFSGSIEIDGIDISKVDIHELRSKITVVPQEPVLFNGTLRFNLDPFHEFTDEFLIQMLKSIDIWKTIRKESKERAKQAHDSRKQIRKNMRLDRKKHLMKRLNWFPDLNALYQLQKSKSIENSNQGLYLQLSENGSCFSVGERQILCICRAILRKNKIVIFDEATSNIDIVTEQKIQKLVHEHFKEATMLTIAHRLNTIINSDKILLLNKGTVQEYDSPANLLANPTSHFSQLIAQIKQSEDDDKSTNQSTDQSTGKSAQ